MTKIEAINKCKDLLSVGIYARPYKQFLHEKYDILILHPFGTTAIPSGLHFLDCIFYRWEGMKTIDYPLYS